MKRGCGSEFPYFGASYPDAVCIDGYLYDMDSYDSDANGFTSGGNDPCPICNTEKWLEHVVDEDFSKEKALEYVNKLKNKYGK